MPIISITHEFELVTPTEKDPYEYRNTIIFRDTEDDDSVFIERPDLPRLIKELQKLVDEPAPVPLTTFVPEDHEYSHGDIKLHNKDQGREDGQ